ncbi:hypothetical protein H0H93_010289 [Arthromyces matolae]|nr:hypothetical protein H0H93_010289 [Arthromyces matolae]
MKTHGFLQIIAAYTLSALIVSATPLPAPSLPRSALASRDTVLSLYARTGSEVASSNEGGKVQVQVGKAPRSALSTGVSKGARVGWADIESGGGDTREPSVAHVAGSLPSVPEGHLWPVEIVNLRKSIAEREHSNSDLLAALAKVHQEQLSWLEKENFPLPNLSDFVHFNIKTTDICLQCIDSVAQYKRETQMMASNLFIKLSDDREKLLQELTSRIRSLDKETHPAPSGTSKHVTVERSQLSGCYADVWKEMVSDYLRKLDGFYILNPREQKKEFDMYERKEEDVAKFVKSHLVVDEESTTSIKHGLEVLREGLDYMKEKHSGNWPSA